MKKLKVVLTLLLALCCSLCMFACGGEKTIADGEVTGQTKNFKEHEDFSLGSNAKVVVYYQGDDEAHELKPEEYEVDSSAYDKDLAGEYAIYIIPKNQPKSLTEGGKDNRWKYYYSVTVDHDWQDKGNGQYTCSCGAVRNEYTGLNDQIKTVAWGTPATFTPGGEGKTYPDAKAPIPGENHVSYGSLVKGQSLKLNIQITGLTRTDNPATASAWDTPLMGIRNVSVGMLPREDGWIIATAAGFALPSTSNIPSAGAGPASGLATANDAEWTVYGQGTTWSAGSAFPKTGAKVGENLDTDWSKVDVEYIYQSDDVFMIRHTLHKFDGSADTVYTVTTKVPDNAYEVVVYGEYCNFTITGADFVAGRAITDFQVTKDPTKTVQPEGKLFDTTGLDTKATFSDGNSLTGSYNAYAFHDVVPTGGTEAVKTRVSLGTTPLTADLYDFMVEFNGKQAWLTKDGKESTAENKATNQKIKVVATPITGANTSVIKSGDVAFEAPDVAYDYTVTSTTDTNAYIKLVATGSATKATTAQATALGSGSTHFVAFKLVTNLADIADTVTASTASNVVVKATKAGKTVDVVLGLKDGFAKTFDLTLKDGTKVQIDLSGIAALSKYGAEVTASNFFLDVGGTYTVEYTGLGDAAAINKLTLPVVAKRDTVETVAKAAKGTYTTGTPTEDNSYKASNNLYVTAVKVETGKLTVTYWLAAPELGNLTAEACTTAVSLRDGDTTLATANLTYTLAVSSAATKIAEGVYVKANGNKLQVYTFGATTEIKSGTSFAASLNIENETAASYNVGVTISAATDTTPIMANWLDLNDLTSNTSSAAKLVALGTVDDVTDYDKGYILVANLHLPAIGLREGSAHRADVYHFTVNEDADYPTDTYTVYTVGSADDSNKITSEEKAVAGLTLRENVVKFTCLQDGRNAYEYKYKAGDEDKVFLFGARAVKASGEHTWEPADGNDRNCTVCGAHYMKFTDSDGTVRELTDLPTITRVVNPDADKDDWWRSPTADIPVTGDFVVRYSWTNTDANYPGDGAVELHDADSNYFGYRTFEADFNPGTPDGDSTSALHASDKVMTTVYKKDGETVDDILGVDGVSASDWKGEAYVSVYRYGTTLVIDAHLTLADGKTTYQVTTTITKFTTKDLILHINGNHYWCDKLMVGIGSATTTSTTSTTKTVVSTGDLRMTIGKPDNSTGYTAEEIQALRQIVAQAD